jgi:RHS repeat-associated protein
MISRITIVLILLVSPFQTANASFGRTAGQFGVSSSGTAQYSIPIWAPPGPRGIQPNIALAYDSAGGIGSVGLGWSLAGLGAISRCNKTVAQDTIPAPVGLLVSDGYCINGNRLRLTSGTYGVDSSTYQTEVADFSNVTAHGAAGQGPAYFTVQGRDGVTYDYGYVDSNGNGANSQVLATGTTTAAAWMLSKVIDRAGNNYVINYTTLSGAAVPSAIRWTPTSAGAATYTYTMQFNYSSNVPQGTVYKYLDGTVVTNNQLLSSVEILNGTTVLRDYFLGYQASPSTGRNELNSIKECADSAQTNCLLPTSVTYQAGAAGVSTTSSTALSSTGGCLRARYDLNGDGIPDLVYSNGTGALFVAFGTGSGYGTPVSVGITSNACPLIGNLTGGGEDGILSGASGTWTYYTWNGTSFVSASTGLAFDGTAGYQLADIDGDGRPDLISYYNTFDSGTGKTTTTVYSRLNTSTSGAPSFSATLTLGASIVSTSGATLLMPDFQYGKLRRFDFNGDGRDDLALEVVTGRSPNFVVNTYEMLSTGTAFTLALISSGSGSSVPVFFADWNDDACTDFVAAGTLYISGCNGTTPATFPIGNVLAAADWDGDGRTDLIVANGTTLGVYLSTGAGITTLQSTSIPYSSTCQYVTMDVNADGLDDLGCWSQTGTNPITYYLHNGPAPDLAIDFFDGYGAKYTASYMALSQATSANYTKGTSQVFPQQDYDGPLYVTQYALMPNGIGTTYTVHYDYTGAVMNLQGRGFQGFTTVNVLSDQVHFNDTKTYSTGTLSGGIVIPTAGMLLGETVITTGGTNVRNAQYTLGTLTLDATSNNERYFPYTASSSANTYEIQPGGSYNGRLITTTATNYNTPDIYGNFSDISTTVTDADTGSPYYNQQWTTTTATTISASPSTWCNSLPTEMDVTKTAPGVPAITRHNSYVSPDYTNCRQTEQVVESGSAYQVDTKYGYDPNFGTLTSQIVTGASMPARTTSIAWGTTGQFPTSTTNPMYPAGNPLAQTTQFNFDPVTGKPLSLTDPNGITTSWQYDPFARKSKEIRPDGTSTTWAYNNCATAGCVNSNNRMTVVQTSVNSDGSTLNVQNSYFDYVDRVLVTSRQMINGAYDRNEVQYNGLGTVQQQAAPCTFVSCVYYWTTNSYDNLKRLTQSQRPISATNSTLQTTTIQYSGRSTIVTDPQGKVTTKITKVTGSVGRTKDNNGYYINFNHDAWGSVLSVTDSLSNPLRTMTPYAYGIAAFKTSMTDMDLGSRSYTHDALGEVTAYSDGKGQSFSAIFDALSRMTSRTEPDLTTTWTWGATKASHNIGKLASVSSTGTGGTYSESYTFDSFGRLSNETITLPTDGTPAFDYAYSTTTGLLSTLTYPPSFPSTYRLTAGYTYQHGILQQIFDSLVPTTIWWQANAMNPRGQITEETTEDLSGHPQIVSNRVYDAVTGWLNSTQTGAGGGAGLQNEAYLYDEMGNVTQRQNNNAGLTENFYYDNLYRLDHSMLGSNVNLQMGYDAMGDITSRSDVAGGATWTYDPVRKHAVTQAGSSSFTYAYDGNGNVTSRNGSIVGWTSYNYPGGVTTAAESATFDYGPDRQRWRMIYSGPSGNETTFYATPKFEKVYAGGGGEYRSYIYAGNRPVVVVMRNTASQINVRSLLVDHQGSISSIVTDSTGASLVSESFTAYGNRREASTWTGAPTSAELATMNGVTREGYTFQTVLGSMGLNHMNGRIEDSVTGRFLSPDTRGTSRGNTQSWNRYSYALNNPLTFTDPTGHNPFVRCSGEFCPTQHPGRKQYYDVGSLGPTSNNTSGLSDGMQGTDVTNAGLDAMANNGYLIAFDPNTGTSATRADPTGGDDAAAGSTVDVPGVGTHPATNTYSFDENGVQTVTVDIYSPDAPPTHTPSGVNTAPIWASSTFRSGQPWMNLAGNLFKYQVAVIAPEFLAAVPFVNLPPAITFPTGGTTAAACLLCATSTASDAVSFGVQIAETLNTRISLTDVNMGTALETALESGNQAFDEALSQTLWGNQPPPVRP